MRPDVTVGSVTTGGMVEPRADWTETARSNLLAALKAQQAGRGGNVLVLERRDGLPGVEAETVAELERLHYAVGSSIALHKYSGAYLPTKRGKGLDWTLGQDAVARCQERNGLFIVLPPRKLVSPGRLRASSRESRGARSALRADLGRWTNLPYATLVDLRPAKGWFNVCRQGPGRGDQVGTLNGQARGDGRAVLGG